MLDVAASMALDGQLAFAALARSEDELTRLEEERADLTTKRRRYEYMGACMLELLRRFRRPW